MRRCLWIPLLLLLLLSIAHISPALAQANPYGWTTYTVNLRAGPGANHPVLTTLAGGTDLLFEARSADLAWLLASALDGAHRGWVATLYIGYAEGFGSPTHLPISDEIMSAPPIGAASDAPVVDEEPSAPGGEAVPAGMDLDAATVRRLESMPIVPSIGGRVNEIYARGQALGNDPRVFTQIGECNTLSQAFIVPFAAGAYDLGPYSELLRTIDFFSATPVAGVSNSLWYKGVAMTTGLTSLAVIDPAFSDPALCPAGLSLLECEYERSKPSVALINLGLYDVYWLTPEQYAYAMRQIVEISIAHGVIPVLTTFPTHPGDVAMWPNDAAARNHNRAAFNTTVLNLAAEYGVPVMNLWRATNPIHWHGLRPGDYQHV
ncbi:MAG: hypothetical protein EHM39_09135, partial [Chloroflexi bacterium]